MAMIEQKWRDKNMIYKNKHKVVNAVCGFGAGLFTAPVALVVWPIFVAWIAWNDAEGESAE